MLAKALLTAALVLPLVAQAQSYRCVGKDGKKYYGSAVPPQCAGQPGEMISWQGTVLKRIVPDSSASAEERGQKEADEAARKKQATLSREQSRPDQALLGTYASEKDIEDSRRRALENDQRALADLEGKVAALKKSRAAPKADVQDIDMQLGIQEK